MEDDSFLLFFFFQIDELRLRSPKKTLGPYHISLEVVVGTTKMKLFQMRETVVSGRPSGMNGCGLICFLSLQAKRKMF